MSCASATHLSTAPLICPAYLSLQVIAIDEAQFFPDLVEFCTEAVDNYGKHVIVAGLSGVWCGVCGASWGLLSVIADCARCNVHDANQHRQHAPVLATS